VQIAFADSLDMSEMPTQSEAPDPQGLPDHTVAWHYRTRSAAAPPLRNQGWLALVLSCDGEK